MAQTKHRDRRPRRRMDPAARREQIIDAARPLFAQRPVSQITLADVAEAAGCSRALIHSYFGDVPKLFLAVLAKTGAALADSRQPHPDATLEERIALNTDAGLAIAGNNREIWWGVMGHRSSGNAEIDALADAIIELNVQRMLDNNAGLIEDTPATRSALRALIALAAEVTRQWFSGEITRDQAAALLVTANVEVLRRAIPAMQAASRGAGDAG